MLILMMMMRLHVQVDVLKTEIIDNYNYEKELPGSFSDLFLGRQSYLIFQN